MAAELNEKSVIQEDTEKIPYKAIILVRPEIALLHSTGQLNSVPVRVKSAVLELTGETFEDCQNKLNSFIEEIQSVHKKYVG